MAGNQQNLLFDIDSDDLEHSRQSLGATLKEMLAAYNRSISRTSVTMKALSNRFMRDSLGARSMKLIRKRMQTHRYSFRLGGAGDGELDQLKLWYGLNDMSIGHLKGRVSRLGTRKNPRGAEFSGRMGNTSFSQGFVTRRYKRRSIFMRKSQGRFPIAEARVPIESLKDDLEDEVFPDLPDVFMQHFKTDLKGRVAARGVIKNRQRGWNQFK